MGSPDGYTDLTAAGAYLVFEDHAYDDCLVSVRHGSEAAGMPLNQVTVRGDDGLPMWSPVDPEGSFELAMLLSSNPSQAQGIYAAIPPSGSTIAWTDCQNTVVHEMVWASGEFGHYVSGQQPGKFTIDGRGTVSAQLNDALNAGIACFEPSLQPIAFSFFDVYVEADLSRNVTSISITFSEAVVPEPATLLLAATSAVALVSRRRSRA